MCRLCKMVAIKPKADFDPLSRVSAAIRDVEREITKGKAALVVIEMALELGLGAMADLEPEDVAVLERERGSLLKEQKVLQEELSEIREVRREVVKLESMATSRE